MNLEKQEKRDFLPIVISSEEIAIGEDGIPLILLDNYFNSSKGVIYIKNDNGFCHFEYDEYFKKLEKWFKERDDKNDL